MYERRHDVVAVLDLARQAPLVVHGEHLDALALGADREPLLGLGRRALVDLCDVRRHRQGELLGARRNRVPQDARLDLLALLVVVGEVVAGRDGEVEPVDRAVEEAVELDVEARREDGRDEAGDELEGEDGRDGRHVVERRPGEVGLLDRDRQGALVVVHLGDAAQDDLADVQRLGRRQLLGVGEGEEGREGREAERERVARVLDVVDGGGQDEAALEVALGDALVDLLRLERQLDAPGRAHDLVALAPAELGLRVADLARDDDGDDPLARVEERRQAGEALGRLVGRALVLVVRLVLVRVVVVVRRLVAGPFEAGGELGRDVGDGDVAEELVRERDDELERADLDDLAERLGAGDEALQGGAAGRVSLVPWVVLSERERDAPCS